MRVALLISMVLFSGCRPCPSAQPCPERVATACPADAAGTATAVVPDASGPVLSGTFSCQAVQTFCGGMDRFAEICREVGGSHVLVMHPMTAMIARARGETAALVELRYREIASQAIIVEARTCAGEYDVPVTVNAEAVP